MEVLLFSVASDCVSSVLLIMQSHLLKTGRIPTIMPGALLPFHWPRTDLDQLLCLRLVTELLDIITSPPLLCYI